MRRVCIWGETPADVEAAYSALPDKENPSNRVSWRLTASFDAPVGDACFAPGQPEIEAAYRDAGLEVISDDAPPIESAFIDLSEDE